MIRITLRQSVATLAVIAGLLAAAGPAGAHGVGADAPSVITMLDYEGSTLRAITYNGHAGLGAARPNYPHARNNDAGFEAAPEFWEFFRTHRLP